MVYITGDIHADIKEFQQRMWPYKLTASDTLLVTGDFGFTWDKWTIMQWMKFDHPYTVLFCDGNHENFDMLDRLPLVEGYGDIVSRVDGKTFRLLTGHMYDIEGLKTFVFGGARSIDKDWRIDPDIVAMHGKLWWEQEIPSKETFELARRTLKEHDWTFDIFLSHTCNPGMKNLVLGENAVQSFVDPVEHMIWKLEQEILNNGGNWNESYFGHLHSDYDMDNRHCIYKRVVCLK